MNVNLGKGVIDMRAKRMFAIVKETLEQLEGNASRCLERKDAKHAQMYMDYATGVRMVIDSIEGEME